MLTAIGVQTKTQGFLLLTGCAHCGIGHLSIAVVSSTSRALSKFLAYCVGQVVSQQKNKACLGKQIGWPSATFHSARLSLTVLLSGSLCLISKIMPLLSCVLWKVRDFYQRTPHNRLSGLSLAACWRLGYLTMELRSRPHSSVFLCLLIHSPFT